MYSFIPQNQYFCSKRVPLPLSRLGQGLTEHVQSQVSDSSLFTEIRLKFVVLQ